MFLHRAIPRNAIFSFWERLSTLQRNKTLSGASIYAQNTTYGTISNAEGTFALKLPNGGYELVISYTGYDKKSIRVSNTQQQNDTLIIALPQIDKSLAEVAIVSSNEVEDGLTKYGKFFFDNFIGTTPNAAHCSVQNPQVLHFFYTKNKKRNRLKVTASEDLLIKNDALEVHDSLPVGFVQITIIIQASASIQVTHSS